MAHSFIIVCARAILLSFAWTMQVLRGLVHVHFAGIALNYFTINNYIEDNSHRTLSTRSWWSELLGMLYLSRGCAGYVCIGAVVEPAIGVVRGAARAVEAVGVERDEFMFSCESWCSGVGKEVARYGNRWGLCGSWVDRSYATAVAIYAFLIGYLMARIGMARSQACVCVVGSICLGPEQSPVPLNHT
ncbi:hypothetical protein Syun_017273 [Stephania yunnanensis]|uniref:Uncharacterized protein n=1 Tax=Stephania yunnanensis TaxID=152371 RepID=A0AAP0J8V8_9MAGN